MYDTNMIYKSFVLSHKSHLMKNGINHKKKRFLVKGNEKYEKISYRQKILLLKKVLIDKEEIKKTSEALNINYSTAKTFLRKFRGKSHSLNTAFIQNVCQWFSSLDTAKRRCQYKYLSMGVLAPDYCVGSSKMVSQVFTENSQGQQQNRFANRVSKIEIIQQIMFV